MVLKNRIIDRFNNPRVFRNTGELFIVDFKLVSQKQPFLGLVVLLTAKVVGTAILARIFLFGARQVEVYNGDIDWPETPRSTREYDNNHRRTLRRFEGLISRIEPSNY